MKLSKYPVIATLATVFVLGMGLPASASSSRHNITGSLQITDSGPTGASIHLPSFGGSCDGSTDDNGSGYDDLSAGSQVTVKNGSGHIVAIGTLRTGRSSQSGFECTMPLKVNSVPKASFYQINIGHRGAIDYSYKQMQRKGWRVSLTIGS